MYIYGDVCVCCCFCQDWISCVVMKQAAFHGLSEYYQSCVCKQSKSYGEEIARLKVSSQILLL